LKRSARLSFYLGFGICMPFMSAGPVSAGNTDDEIMANTFSVVAADPSTSEVGVAVATRLPAVGMYVPFARAGVGAVASQAIVNPQYGPKCLELLSSGKSPEQIVEEVTSADADKKDRQLSVVSADGRAAAFTGAANSAVCGHRVGAGYAIAGNLLSSTATLDSMETAFQQSKGRLSDRLLATLAAGETAGGDKRGKQSAALIVVRLDAYFNGKVVDLRVDDSPDPIGELRRVYAVYMSTFLNLPGYRTIESGAKGEDVRKLNLWLKRAGFLTAGQQAENADTFTSTTAEALLNFRRSSGLEPHNNGQIGPEESLALQQLASNKKQ
jgi:uncharacterized Ntn-hydrolase superfamily protein